MILSPDVEELIAALRAEIVMLRAEVAELKRRLGQDSSTSSKPPSSDGLEKKPRIAGGLREASGKPSGRQKGHKGDTLRQAAEPDRIVRHEASHCRHCQALLGREMARGVEARPSVRSDRAAADRHRASGFDLSLRPLPESDEGRVPARRGLAHAIWRAGSRRRRSISTPNS